MKKIAALIALTAVAVTFSACGWYWDDFMNFNSPPLRVMFQIEPDDAHILLNGRFIGEAYEFSSKATALELQSKRNEILIKREGYVEEIVDLLNYSSTQITVRMQMKKALPGPPLLSAPPAPVQSPADAETDEAKKPEYVATPALPEEPAPAKDDMAELSETLGHTASVTMEIQPPEAAIYLDGKFWGIAPEGGKISNLRLKVGSHTIVVAKPGYVTETKTLKIKDQEQVQVSIQLKKKDEGMVL